MRKADLASATFEVAAVVNDPRFVLSEEDVRLLHEVLGLFVELREQESVDA